MDRHIVGVHDRPPVALDMLESAIHDGGPLVNRGATIGADATAVGFKRKASRATPQLERPPADSSARNCVPLNTLRFPVVPFGTLQPITSYRIFRLLTKVLILSQG